MDVHLKKVFGTFQEHFCVVGRGSDLLEVKGINTAFIEALFREIAGLWHSSPWKRLGSKDLLGVKVGKKEDWKPLAGQPFKCVRFSGARGKGHVVDVLRSEQDAAGADGKPTKACAVPETGVLRITFGPETELFPSVRKMIRSFGLQIAGPNAYPSVEVIYPSKAKASGSAEHDGDCFVFHSPELLELRWLIACLQAVTRVHPALQVVEKPGAWNNFEGLLQNVELSLPTAADAEGYYLSGNKSTVIVRVTYPPKVCMEYTPTLYEVGDEPSSSPTLLASRQCITCLQTMPSERSPRCGNCKAVIYCGLICQKKHWMEAHKNECDEYKGMMARSHGLELKEFSFPVLEFERPCRWLEQIGLHNKGMWRRLCTCYQTCAFGHLPVSCSSSGGGGYAHEAAWGLEHGNYPPDAPLTIHDRKIGITAGGLMNSISINGIKLKRSKSSTASSNCSNGAKGNSKGSGSSVTFAPPGGPEGSHRRASSPGTQRMTRVQQWVNAFEAAASQTTYNNCRPRSSIASTENDGSSSSKAISGWLDYYHRRNLPFSSPVAAILTYPLTVYHILTNLCASTKSILAKTKEATIHYLGPQGELDWLPAFAEIGHLLDASHAGSLHIVMVGPQVPKSLAGEAATVGKRLRITYVQGLYHEEATALMPPHAVLALNAGLDRSETWAGDLSTIKQQAVPTFFTDYAESCCLSAKQVLLAAELPLTVAVTPNAFRSPARCRIAFTDMPWYVNGFVFGVNT